MTVLVTGGAGYIGSHTTLLLLEKGYEVVVYDNLSNASVESVRRVEKLTNKKIAFVEGDIRDKATLRRTFETYPIDATIHFAGLKAVGESVQAPLKYYENNVCGTVALCDVMSEYGCKSMVFSSSATVYGEPEQLPITEDAFLKATNPYGRTKLMIEKILRDLWESDKEWKVMLLRYFNPVGAHESGEIGEDPNGIPNNLMPYIAQVAIGKRAYLSIFGNDYDTPDGTGVRDYIHVMDLAEGHIKALEKLPQVEEVTAINLGTGQGHSVLEVVSAFEKASKRRIPYKFAPRRSGDVAACYADASFAKRFLGWEAQRDLNTMCADMWHWQYKNPNGYRLEENK